MQSKREEQSTCLNKAPSPCRESGRDVRSRSKAPSSNSCNSRRSKRRKRLSRKQQLLSNCSLIRVPSSIMLKWPLLIRLAQILLLTSKICRACNLPKKKRRLILAAWTCLWNSSSTKRAASSKTFQETWSGPNETEESRLSDSLAWTKFILMIT